MKAIMCKEFAPVENLSWEEVPDPVPGDDEIVFDVTVQHFEKMF